VDILNRRINPGWRVRLPPDAVRHAAETVADILDWNETRVEKEIDDFQAYVRAQHLQG